jgi:hypothetical protein
MEASMPVALPEPDGEREGIPLWLCPNCDQFKPLEAYGWNMRKDISSHAGAIAASTQKSKAVN